MHHTIRSGVLAVAVCVILLAAAGSAVATPPSLPATLPGTYHCNFGLGKTLGLFSAPPGGLYDLRLRSGGTYAFGGTARYPHGTFSFNSATKSLRFVGGFLGGVHGKWLSSLHYGSLLPPNATGVKLSSFAISPGAAKGKHDCVKL